jgi:hypothetical protein
MGSKGGGGVAQHDLDHPLHQHALDGGVGPALHAHGRGAATAAQQHVDDGVDQVGLDREQAEVVQLLGPEHAQHGGQRDRVQVVAEADRGDVVEADLDVVGGEVPQRGGHQPHQTVEDDLQHRQALVRDERGVDDGLDAGLLGPVFPEVEAQQAVDLILVEDAFAELVGPALGRIDRLRAPGVGLLGGGLVAALLRAPRRGEVVLIDLFLVHPWINISSMSTAFTSVGAATRFTRRRISMRSW